MGIEHIQSALKASKQILEGSVELDVFTAEKLLTTQPPERDYLIDGLPLGVVGLIVANGGVGKSYFTVDLALSVASCAPVAGRLYSVNSPGSVLFVVGEDDKDELHRRLHAICHKKFSSSGESTVSEVYLGKVGSKIHFIDLTANPEPFMDQENNPSSLFFDVLGIAKRMEDIKLIVIDPMRRFCYGDENDSRAATSFIVLLEKLAKEVGATVLAVHHMSKSGGSSKSQDQYAARGSSGFTDAVRWQLNLARISNKQAKEMGVPEDQQYRYLSLEVTKNNYGPPQAGRIILERSDKGGLEYWVPDQSSEDLLVENIVLRVKELHDTGCPLAKTEFIKKFGGKGGFFGVSENKLRDNVKHAVEKNLITLQKDPTHKGKGAPPQLLVPGEVI